MTQRETMAALAAGRSKMNNFGTVRIEHLEALGVERELAGIPVNREAAIALGLAVDGTTS